MKKISLLLAISVFCFVTACKQEKKEAENADAQEENAIVKEEAPKTLKVMLEAKSESTATGEVTFTEENGNVTMVAHLNGLEEGEHAIHIHEKADCSSADGKSTGGHWNPTFKAHGKWGSEEGYHKGDIGNFTADSTGHGMINLTTDEWCIGCGDQTKDILGKAIIVHAGSDDFTTQPTGAAGGRVSCGGIIQ